MVMLDGSSGPSKNKNCHKKTLRGIFLSCSV